MSRRFPGLQPERTGLAWQRTALVAGAVALLQVHAAAQSGWGSLTVPAAVTGATALALALVGGRRERLLRREPDPPPLPATMIAGVTTLVATVALITLATLLR